MPWCPKCKCEYEEGVKLCADCKIELVDSLDDIVEWETLIKTEEEEQAIEVVEYLKYSGIEEVRYEKLEEEDKQYFSVLVTDQEVSNSMKYLKGYMITKNKEKKEETEDIEEEIINEYETEDYKDDSKLKDLKSSVYSFGIMGAILLIFGILAITKVITINFSNQYLFSGIILAVGITFIIIAIKSSTGVSVEASKIVDRDSNIDQIIEWFGENYSLDNFASKYDIQLEGMDEGDIYYIVMDKLKEIIGKQFVEVDKKQVNTASEIIFEKMSN